MRSITTSMVSCSNCGWMTANELIQQGLCLTCSQFHRRTGIDRPPPDTLEHVHRGETWPLATDPRVRDLLARAHLDR
jgi:hypothetical protein